MNAIDTNVLMYAFDPRDPEKRRRARELITALDDGALPFQVACEFMSASKKLESSGFNPETAGQVLEKLRAVWSTILPTWEVLD